MEKLILIPITDGYHHKEGESFEWYSVINVDKAEIAFIREQDIGDSYVDISGKIVGFLSYENGKKYNVSTGRLGPFSKISNEDYYSELLLKDMTVIKQDIVYSYEKGKIAKETSKHKNIGDKLSERIRYQEYTRDVLQCINSNIFKYTYIPSDPHDKHRELLYKYDELKALINTDWYEVKQSGVVISRYEIDTIKIKNTELKLDLVYSNIMENSLLPNCFIYRINDKTLLTFELANYLLSDQHKQIRSH